MHNRIGNGVARRSQDGTPGKSYYASLLRTAGTSGSLEEGKCIHHSLREHLKSDIFLSNLVVQMYGNCGEPDEARAVFNGMHSHDIYSWNFMLKGYAKAGCVDHTLQLFEQMHQQGIMPNKFVYVTTLSAFTNIEHLASGKPVHVRAAHSEYACDMIVQTGFVSMYAKCGCLKDAKYLFERMHEKDAASWNPLVAGYAQHGMRKESLQLLWQMHKEGMQTNVATIVTVLSTCSDRAALADGRWIHSVIKGTDIEGDSTVCNALIAMYAKCGSLEEANNVFDAMQDRNKITYLNILTACACEASLDKAKKLHDCILESGLELKITIGNALINTYGKCGGVKESTEMFNKMVKRNLITWNTLLAAYAQNMEGKCALQLLNQMLQEGALPNKVTFVSSVDACASLEDEAQGRRLHALLINSEFEHDVYLGTAFIHMYGKCKNVKCAQETFDNTNERDVACWNAIINMHSQHDQMKSMFLHSNQMKEEGVLPDKITFVSILSGCTNEVIFKEAKQLHACITSTGLADEIVISNALINMYGKCSSLKDAVTFFDRITKRDNVSFINIFSLCGSKGALLQGCRLHDRIRGGEIEADVVVGNVLINMYGKCGSLRHARLFFDHMPERNVVSWNAMLSLYAQYGLGQIALKFFESLMKDGTIPNPVTLVCVLCACSHTGLLDEGYDCFSSMSRKHGISPNSDHYNCMIDMLTRAGKLDEAEEMIKQMPFEASVVTWTTLLGACRTQVDAERAARAAQRVLKLYPGKSSTYITLANIFTAAVRDDDGAFATSLMRSLKWCPGSCQEMTQANKVEVLESMESWSVGERYAAA